MRVNAELIRKLDDLRRDRDDFPSRAQIIREAVEAAHTAKEKTPGAPTPRV
jgi:metal-responsive CopG/Arc/MetJ family transcriptional regulator